MKHLHIVLLLLCTLALASCGSSTEAPPQAENADVYLPSTIGNSWVYQLAGGNRTYRSMIADTLIEGINYVIMQDSTQYISSGQSLSFVDSTYLRSDELHIYELVSTSPRLEIVDLDTMIGATWVVLQDTTMTPVATRWQYTTVALLPSFTVDTMRFSDVLQIETVESFPDHPEFGTTLYEMYYAKHIGQVEVLDSSHSIVALKIEQYSVH